MSTEPAPRPEPTNADVADALEALRYAVTDLANEVLLLREHVMEGIDNHGQRIKRNEARLTLIEGGAPTERPPDGAA